MSRTKPPSARAHKTTASGAPPVPDTARHSIHTTPPLRLAGTSHQKWVELTGIEQGQARKPQKHAPKVWHIGTTGTDWQVVSVGEGEVTFDPRQGILMNPKPSAALPSNETHATLLLAKESLKHPLRNFEATVTFTNVAQLREGEPNDWEVFWLFFNYTLDAAGKKKTNYVTIKPKTGVEIGRAFDEVGQEFLLTDNKSTIQVGTTHTIKVTKKGPHVAIQLDGKPVAHYRSAANPKYIYDVRGAIGLYSEDAAVRVSKVTIKPLP